MPGRVECIFSFADQELAIIFPASWSSEETAEYGRYLRAAIAAGGDPLVLWCPEGVEIVSVARQELAGVN